MLKEINGWIEFKLSDKLRAELDSVNVDHPADWLALKILIPHKFSSEKTFIGLWERWCAAHPEYKDHIMPFLRWMQSERRVSREVVVRDFITEIEPLKVSGNEVNYENILDVSIIGERAKFPAPPFKFNFIKELVASNNRFTEIPGWFPDGAAHINISNNRITSLSGMDKIVKRIYDSLNITNNPIQRGLLSLLKIETGPNFKIYNSTIYKGFVVSKSSAELDMALRILTRYLKEPPGNARIIACQSEMLDVTELDLSELATL